MFLALDGLRQFLAHTGDLEFCGVTAGLDIDRDHILLIGGDNGAVVLIGSVDRGTWEPGFVEATDFIDRIAALEIGCNGVHVSEAYRGCAVFLGLRSRVNVDTEIFGCLFGILGGFDGAEWTLHLYVITFLGDVRMFGEVNADDGKHSNAEDAEANDHGDDSKDSFESAVVARRRWHRRRGSHDRSRWCGGDGSAAFIAETCGSSERCAAGIAECHKSPRGW
jgi:hypothetical protein